MRQGQKSARAGTHTHTHTHTHTSISDGNEHACDACNVEGKRHKGNTSNPCNTATELL